MSQQPKDFWEQPFFKAVGGFIAFATALVAFINLLKENYHLGFTAIGGLLIGLALYFCIKVLTARDTPQIGTIGPYKYPQYHTLARVGTGVVTLTLIAVFAFGTSRRFVWYAFAGTPTPTATFTATPTPTGTPTHAPTPSPTRTTTPSATITIMITPTFITPSPTPTQTVTPTATRFPPINPVVCDADEGILDDCFLVPLKGDSWQSIADRSAYDSACRWPEIADKNRAPSGYYRELKSVLLDAGIYIPPIDANELEPLIRGDNGGFARLPACEIGSADLPCIYTVQPDDYQNGIILYNYTRLAVIFYGRAVDEEGNDLADYILLANRANGCDPLEKTSLLPGVRVVIPVRPQNP